MLQLKDTPRFARDDLVMTHAQHEQVGQDRNAHGFLTAILVPTDLVLAQAQARFQLPVQELDCPRFLIVFSSAVFQVRAIAKTKPHRRAGSALSRSWTMRMLAWEP